MDILSTRMASTKSKGEFGINLRKQVSQVSPSSHRRSPPVQVERDIGDTWDTRKCVSVALSIGTLCGYVLYALCGWRS